MQQDSMTFSEAAHHLGITRLGVYMKFKRNLSRMIEGEDFTREPISSHTKTIITPSGLAKLYPCTPQRHAPRRRSASLPPRQPHYGLFGLSAC